MSVPNLTEASREEIYTRIGPVLVSINPYKWIAGLYDDETKIRYQRKVDLVESGILCIVPHLFGVADHAYSQLVTKDPLVYDETRLQVRGHVDAEAKIETEVKIRKSRASNQSIIISGESGSGKTEAMKIIIHYFVRITLAKAENSNCGNVDAPASTEEAPARTLGKKSLNRKMPVGLNMGELETRLLSCNPLLESFGNAATLKNDNSSRFGNFTKIQFDKRGNILGSQIQNYLLEKTRIVDHAKRERSYHVFYQMLAGASSALKKELKKELRLEKGVAGFECLRGSSMKEGDAQGQGFEVHSIETTMQRTVDQAYDKTAALGKALYSQLFLWLVAKLNTTISAPQSDVWGFMNYANEYLQRHFNQHMFEVEQIGYKKEQIGWSCIPFTDNKACLELIGGEGGLLSLLDDSQRFEAKKTNQIFLSSFKQSFGPPGGSGWGGARRRLLKLSSCFSIGSPARRSAGGRGHPHFVLPRFNKDNEDSSFGIKHYAGEVMCNVSKFSQKSHGNLTADVKDLMATSTRRLVLNVFKVGVEGTETDGDGDGDGEAPCTAEGYGRGRGGASGRTMRSKSVGIQFQESLADLMGTISVTQPRFIRCIKPNPDKETRFDGEDVLLQLRYSGTMETIRILQQEQEEAPATNLGATAAAVPGISPRPSRNVEVSLLRRSRDGSVGGPTRDSCSGSNGEEWWSMLAHRTGDGSVPQALMSHGLPPAERRSIWGAWTARCARAEARVTSTLVAKTSTTIAHDVRRTKVDHHLFSAGEQGVNMLTRVLLRCAELGAVGEVGYVQGMSQMAGFLLVTIADAVSAERDDCRLNGGTAAPAPGTFAGGDTGTEASPLEVIETECVQGMLGMVAMQGGILSKDLCGLHANTDLLGELMSKFSPEVMDHFREINVDLIFFTPRWFVGIYAGSMTSHTLIARIWDVYLWHGRRGPAVLVWAALSLLHGCRRHIMESADLPTAVKAVHRHVDEIDTFDDLVRQAPADLGQVAAAWDAKNRRIACPSPIRSPKQPHSGTWKVCRCLRRWGAAWKRWVGSS